MIRFNESRADSSVYKHNYLYYTTICARCQVLIVGKFDEHVDKRQKSAIILYRHSTSAVHIGGTIMLPVQRHRQILDILEREAVASVRAMAEELEVAESTIRRDLDTLEAKGLVKRTYGGALLLTDDQVHEPPFLERQIMHHEEKDRIGQAAAALVANEEAIFLDGGTTTECIVPYLVERRGLTVVTCGLNIAVRLSMSVHITTILVGGELHVPSLSFAGVLAQKAMELYDLRFSKAFIAAGGVSAQYGITNRIIERIPMKRLAIQLAREVIVVADGSKIGKVVLGQVVPVTAMHRLITDESAPQPEREAIADQGVVITVV